MKKRSRFFKKSKKGFSLIELLCAVVIIAIVVAGTASGLAVSHRSILIGAEKDKASARAQAYCDIIMTYVECTPSIDQSLAFDDTIDHNKNLLFETPYNNYMLKKDDIIKDQFVPDFKNIDSNITAIEQITKANLATRTTKSNTIPYFIIEKEGTTGNLASYRITVYVDYANSATTYCTGVVTKPLCDVT